MDSADLLGEPTGLGDEADSGVLLALSMLNSSSFSLAELFDLCGILKLLNEVLKPKPRLEAKLGDCSGGVLGLAVYVDDGFTKLANI